MCDGGTQKDYFSFMELWNFSAKLSEALPSFLCALFDRCWQVPLASLTGLTADRNMVEMKQNVPYSFPSDFYPACTPTCPERELCPYKKLSSWLTDVICQKDGDEDF